MADAFDPLKIVPPKAVYAETKAKRTHEMKRTWPCKGMSNIGGKITVEGVAAIHPDAMMEEE